MRSLLRFQFHVLAAVGVVNRAPRCIPHHPRSYVADVRRQFWAIISVFFLNPARSVSVPSPAAPSGPLYTLPPVSQ